MIHGRYWLHALDDRGLEIKMIYAFYPHRHAHLGLPEALLNPAPPRQNSRGRILGCRATVHQLTRNYRVIASDRSLKPLCVRWTLEVPVAEAQRILEQRRTDSLQYRVLMGDGGYLLFREQVWCDGFRFKVCWSHPNGVTRLVKGPGGPYLRFKDLMSTVAPNASTMGLVKVVTRRFFRLRPRRALPARTAISFAINLLNTPSAREGSAEYGMLLRAGLNPRTFKPIRPGSQIIVRFTPLTGVQRKVTTRVVKRMCTLGPEIYEMSGLSTGADRGSTYCTKLTNLGDLIPTLLQMNNR